MLALVEAATLAEPGLMGLVMGDFNDGEASDPQRALVATGRLHSALADIDPLHRYSYVFGGLPELIDGIFVTPALYRRLAECGHSPCRRRLHPAWQQREPPPGFRCAPPTMTRRW